VGNNRNGGRPLCYIIIIEINIPQTKAQREGSAVNAKRMPPVNSIALKWRASLNTINYKRQ